MTPEIYTIIAVAIALAGLILNGQRSLAASMTELRKELRADFRGEMGDLRTELRGEIGDLRTELNSLREQMNHDIAALSERVARLEGLLEGLRDAVTGKAA